MTGDELKAELRSRKASGNTNIGSYGERIYAHVMHMKYGRKVQSMHHGGCDFLLDGALHVDVKSTLCLGKRASRRVPRWTGAKQQPGVLYHRVMFYDDVIALGSSRLPGPLAVDRVSWNDAARILSKGSRSKQKWSRAPSSVREGQERVVRDLECRLKARWGVNAKVRRRGNPTAQKLMGAWGPQSFYPYKTQRSSTDLVVLIYFDELKVQEVFAYPMRCLDQISWTPKRVGPRSEQMTFDPTELDAKFKFKSLEHFETDFLPRFLRD